MGPQVMTVTYPKVHFSTYYLFIYGNYNGGPKFDVENFQGYKSVLLYDSTNYMIYVYLHVLTGNYVNS
jgi:hypothetical protein